MNQVVEDCREDVKVRLFAQLTRLAVSRDIALIFTWLRITDPLRGYWEVDYQSFGFPEGPNACVFCGGNPPNGEGDKELGQLQVHRDCIDDAIENGERPSFLPPNSYRPAVIFLEGTCPGSIDNAIVRMAWGIGMHFWLTRRPTAPFKWLDTEARSYGKELVSSILEGREVTCVM
jgi:hypothetical protein